MHAASVTPNRSPVCARALGTFFPAPATESAGVVDAVGEGVTTWNEGDFRRRPGSGGCDFTCEPCRRGDFISSKNATDSGIAYDGGYAEYMIAPAEALARIPEDRRMCPTRHLLLCAA